MHVPRQEEWRGFLWGIPMLLVFAGLLSMEEIIQRVSSVLKTLFLEIGNSSYSLYLVHPFLLSGIAMCLKHFKMASNPYLFTFALLIPTIVAGHLAYLFIERPLTALAKKVFLPSRPAMRTDAQTTNY